MIPGDLYQNYIWKWTEEENLNSKEEAVGLDSRIFMLSMGFPFYLFLITVPLLIVAIIMTIIIYLKKARDDIPKQM
jgi:hypothetical protein